MMGDSIDQIGTAHQTSGAESAPHSEPGLALGSSRPRNSGVGTREAILDAAAQCFAEFGYYGASLRNIAREAEISHPGMLHYFESKSALLDGVIDRLEAHAQNALSRVDELSASPRVLVQGLVEIWDPSSHCMQLFAMLYTDAVSEDHPGRFRVARLRRVHEHVLERCFVSFSEHGLLRAGIDPSFASRVMLDHVLGHAVREKTVRVMQRESHDDSPLADLTRLTDAFLALHAAQEDTESE